MQNLFWELSFLNVSKLILTKSLAWKYFFYWKILKFNGFECLWRKKKLLVFKDLDSTLKCFFLRSLAEVVTVQINIFDQQSLKRILIK